MNNVIVMPGSRTYELQRSKDAKDQKAAKRLLDYSAKAYAANYDYSALQKLREQFKDVL